MNYRKLIPYDTIMSKAAKKVEFNYFHNGLDQHGVIKSSERLPQLDKRFKYISSGKKLNGAKFAGDAKFVRGCISIVAK